VGLFLVGLSDLELKFNIL